MSKSNRLKRYTNWEYWPAYMFYLPILPYAFYLAIKRRSSTFMSTVNPSIKNAGNGTESKYKTLELIPDKYKPKSIFISEKRDFDSVIKVLHKNGIDYPIIAKPDIGFRGILVEKIYSDSALISYLEKFPVNIILQEFIDLPYECGIFYYRLPTEEKGTISSITLKEFLKVTGDGKTKIEDLIKKDKRAAHYINYIKDSNAINFESIPKEGVVISLSDIGNHAKGTQFINGNHLIDKTLTDTFDVINKQIDGWYYGRLDIKYNSFDELRKGENFVILEINGTIAEPTHVYDTTKTSYLKAVETIRKHWKVIHTIAKINIENGVQTIPFKAFWKDVYKLLKYTQKITKLARKSKG